MVYTMNFAYNEIECKSHQKKMIGAEHKSFSFPHGIDELRETIDI